MRRINSLFVGILVTSCGNRQLAVKGICSGYFDRQMHDAPKRQPNYSSWSYVWENIMIQ